MLRQHRMLREHWTPAYAVNRVVQQIRYWRHPDTPWLNNDAITLLEQLLHPSDIGFEWGSGRSTIWIATRVSRLTSVEGDADWHKRIEQALTTKNVKNVTYRFHAQDSALAQDAAKTSYVHQIDEVADGSLDFVLVDGWAREWCRSQPSPS